MKWDVITPPTGLAVAYAIAKHHLRIDGNDERDYVISLIEAATAHAEEALATSLLPRRIAATFYDNEFCDLPRGPVSAIVSVVDANGDAVPADGWRWERKGNADCIRFLRSVTRPITVTYDAGYTNAAAIPADIRQAILCHVGTLYEFRESVTSLAARPVPHLDSFYRLRAREVGIG